MMATQATDTDQSDPDLVARMTTGDQEALSCLYDRHRGLIFTLALRILNDRAEAEEILTDVFLQAWRGAGGFDPARGSVPGWLITLCRSRAIDRIRARGRRVAATTTHSRLEVDAARGAGKPEAEAERRLDAVVKRKRISEALAALTPSQRGALELAYYEGFSHSEIATKLGEPLGTVKTWIRQGLLTLRENLKRYSDEM